MPKIIEANSINELNVLAYDTIINSGKKTTNRNADSLGNIYVEYDVNCVLQNIRNRHLDLNGRSSNIFALIGESMWVMAGREDVSYLLNFIPRASDYSDDGETWRASYGERMYSEGQLEGIPEIFKEDGIFTRRATLTIYDPHKDTKQNLKKVYDLEQTKDIPCNQWLNFYVDSDYKFNMKVIQRSGDAIWGALSINLTEFSILMETVFNSIKHLDDRLTLGSYNHSVTNLHLYENTSKQAFDVLSLEQDNSFKNELELITPTKFPEIKKFFQNICSEIEDCECEDPFDDFGVQKEDNILWYYFEFVQLYVRLKKKGFKGGNRANVSLDPELTNFYNSDNEFAVSMRNSKFRNFEIV